MDIIDETTITRDGIDYRVMIVPDYDSEPEESETYSDSDKAAFTAGEWQYVGVIVRPIIDGAEISDAEDSLWAVEFGHMPAETEPYEGGQHEEWTVGLDDIVNTHPVPDMIGEVRANLAKLRDQITRRLT